MNRQSKNIFRNSIRATLIAVTMLFAVFVAEAQIAISLYESFAGKINYTMIGGSLRTNTTTALKTSDTTNLTLPSGATVIAAYLYWAGSGTGNDYTVGLGNNTLNTNNVNATRTFTESYNNAGTWLYFFSGFADVTSIVTGNGNYIFSGLTVDNGGVYSTSSAVISGWAVVVVYNSPSSDDTRRTINIYDGFQSFRGSQIIITPSNFYVPFSRLDGKVTHITWEGDEGNSAALNGFSENLAFNGQILTNPTLNPINNQFNSISNTLFAAKGYTHGTDIDTYDITSLLTSGDTTASTVYSSGGDLVILSAEVISIADTSNSDIQITKTNSRGASVVAGDTLTYFLSVRNNGPDTTGTITVIDTLPSGARHVSVTASGWTVDSTAKPVFVFRRTGINPPNTTFPLISIKVMAAYHASSYPTMVNRAYVSSPQFDRRLWNNSSSNSITVNTPVLINSTKSYTNLNGTYPIIGDTLLYTIKVTNTGNYAVNNTLYQNPISIIDTVPAGFNIVAGSITPGGTINGQVITFNVINNLAIGASDSVRYRIKIGPSFTGDNPFTNIAHILVPRNALDQKVTSTATPPPTLNIQKAAVPSNAKRNAVVTFNIIVKNLSSTTTSLNTIVRDTITSANLTYVTGSATKGGTYAAGPPRVVSWNLGSMAPGKIDTVSFQVTVGAATPLPSYQYNTAKLINDQRSRDSSQTFVYVTANATGSIFGTVTILPGERIFYTLVDNDLNTVTTTVQTITLIDSNKVTNEWENVTLTETGVNTGIFTGSIPTVYGASAGTNNNGTFNVKPNDSLVITYSDALDSTGTGPKIKKWWTKVLAGNTATLTATSPVKVGGTILYTLTDADLNRSSSIVESIVLRDTCKRTSELENITLTETGPNTGIFTGSIPTIYGATSNGNNNGSFAVQLGDSIIIAYRDTVNNNGQDGGWVYARTYITGGATATITATTPIHPWDSIRITLTDYDLNRNSSLIENYVVRDSNKVTNEFQDVILYERSVNDSVFIGFLPTRYGVITGSNNDGWVYVRQNDSLRVGYIDTMSITGAPGTWKWAITRVLGGNPATLVISKTQIYPSDSIQVTVTDRDLNWSTSLIESYQIRATNYITGEWENITITERASNDSVFIGWIRTAFGTSAGPNNNGSLNVQRNDSLYVSYKDSATYDGAPGLVLTRSARVLGGYTATLIGTANIIPRDSIFYMLTDFDLNRDTTKVDTLTLYATHNRTGEIENLKFTETGIKTGIFTSKIATFYGNASNGNYNGQFVVLAGDTISISYRDTMQTNGGPGNLLTWQTSVRGGYTATIIANPIFMASGDTTLFTITDNDLNKDTTAIENYLINLVSSKGEIETLKFTETGIKTGVFTRLVPTVYGTVAGANGDSIFAVQESDSIIASYKDSLTATGDTVTIRAWVKIGSVIFSASTKSLSDVNGNSPIPPDTIAYTLKIKNTGTVTSRQISVIDTIPLNMTILTGTLPAGTTVSGRVLTFSRFNLAPSDSITLQYSLRIDSTIQNGVAAQNIAHIIANGIDQKLTASFTPVNQPLLKLNKSVDKSHALPGDTLTYTITYRNIGTSNATIVNVFDANPLNTTYVLQSVKLNNVAKTDEADADEVTYSAGSLQISVGIVAPGQVGTISFKVKIN